MRAVLLALVVLLAGCTAEEARPSSPSPSPTPSPSASAPAPTTSEPASPPAPTPADPAPQENATAPPFSGQWIHRHAEGELVVRFEVPGGSPPADASIAILPTLAAAQCDAEGSVVIVSPSGVLLEAQAGEGGGCGTSAAKRNATMHAGTWTIWFNGTGDITSMVVVGAANASRPFSFEEEHDFSDAPRSVPFDVARPILADVELDFEPGLAPSCLAAPEVAIELVDPDGAVAARHALQGLEEDCGAPLVATGVPLAPGKWSVRFAGSGSARGVARVVASS